MMSTELATDSACSPYRVSRSRSSSIIGPASPESHSSDSPSSSDPDTHLSFANSTTTKSLFSIEVDTVSNFHMMDTEADVPFDAELELHQLGVHSLQGADAFQGYVNLDDMVLSGLSNMTTNTKTDILTLEEIIKDGAFEPSSTASSLYQSYPSRSSAFRDFISSSPPSLHESRTPSEPDPIYIDPSSTQQVQPQSYFPSTSQASTTKTSYSSFKVEPSGVLLLSPASQSASTSQMHIASYPSLPRCDPTPSAVLSCEIVCPPSDACLDLPIFFPSIPAEGTKSRVETQIKLTFELGYPIPSSPSSLPHRPGRNGTSTPPTSRPASSSSSLSDSPSTSPALCKRDVPSSKGVRLPTHDKVGTYRYLRLPRGTTTKRKIGTPGFTMASGQCADMKKEEVLDMTAEVACCSPPHAFVQSCSSCQSREAKRTARKVAARVRPLHGARPKAKSKKSGRKGRVQDLDALEYAEDEMEEDEAEPNADASIIQFNCPEILDFGRGSVVLPMRITCYCRHHKEKVGFNIIFALRDHLGRVVGRGTTPPILITDDHKSNNAVSKLPPMHPLRQALNPALLPHAVLVAHNHSEEPSPPATQAAQDQGTTRALIKGRDVHSVSKKRRPKPYDGRPIKRIAGVDPDIEGRHVVLALHPAHTRTHVPVAKGSASELANQSQTASTSSGTESPGTPALRTGLLPSPAHPEKSLTPPLPTLNGLFTPKVDVNMSPVGSGPGISGHVSSPMGLASSLPTTPPSPSSRLPSSGSSQAAQVSVQYLPERKALSPGHQTHLNNSLFAFQPSVPPDSLPKIHRLIPSSGPTTGGIEITVLGSNFQESLQLECVFGGAIASSTHRWSDNTLVCVLPPRAIPGIVGVGFKGIKEDDTAGAGGTCLFNYVDESDRQLMELALQVVGLKMTGKIEEARDVAMRIVGNTKDATMGITTDEASQTHSLPGSGMQFAYNSFVSSLGGTDLETLIIKLLTLLDIPSESEATTLLVSRAIGHRNATGQTLLHLAVVLALPALVSCLIQRSIDPNVRNVNGLTPLHLAALTGWKEGAEMLLTAGADVTAVDLMGFTATDRARCTRSQELVDLLEEASEHNGVLEGESGEEGDDEAWHNRNEVSEDEDSEAEAVTSLLVTAPPQYSAQSRIESPSQTDSEEPFEPEEQQRRCASTHPTSRLSDAPAGRTSADEKQDASFVGRLQRTFPQGILPNMQIPGLPQLQLPGMLAGPWGALPQIPVFPVFVPIPNLPHLPTWPAFPWTDAIGGEKKEPRPDDGNEDKHPPFAMLWTAYDNIANNAWRAQWEKWTAQVTALQNVNSQTTELPPMYTPREKDQDSETEPRLTATPGDPAGSLDSSDAAMDDTLIASTSTSRQPVAKVTRRMRYGTMKVPDTEVDSYYYQPKKSSNQKKDRMLVLFWIPILFIGLAYAVYTTLPVAIASVSKATRELIPRLPRQDDPRL